MRFRIGQSLAIFGILALAACGNNGETDPEVTDDTEDVDRPDDGSGDAEEDADVDDVEEIDTDTEEPDTTPDPERQGDPCTSATVEEDCGPGYRCVELICALLCDSDDDCNDQQECTEDSCLETCKYEYFTGPVRSPQYDDPNDCKVDYCEEVQEGIYSIVEIPDPDPLLDDGIECTIEQCNGTQAQRVNSDAFCDDGNPENGVERCIPAAGGCVTGPPPEWYCPPAEPGWTDTERCGDGQDNNNNGQADENCPCEFGTVQRCYLGDPNTRGVGGCLDGIQECGVRSDPRWGPCQGTVGPSEEVCDNKDNDCNDCADDLDNCNSNLQCPTEDIAIPLTYYNLDTTAIFRSGVDSIRWVITPPPNSATPGPEDPTAATTRVYLDVSGDYQVSLQFKEKKTQRDLRCDWVVRARGRGLRVELKWDTADAADLDLHMLQYTENEFSWFGPLDVYFDNRAPTWGYRGTRAEECPVSLEDGIQRNCNNPRLDIDNQGDRRDPENINLDNPDDGDRFRVMVHAFELSSLSPRKDGTVTFYCGGDRRAVMGARPDSVYLTADQLWYVADVTMRIDEEEGTTTCDVVPVLDDAGNWVVIDQ